MDAARRWRNLVRGRLAEMDRLRPGWSAPPSRDARARRWEARLRDVTDDPFLRRVRRLVGRATTVIDVGAGSGRMALALAPRAAEVVAVDPSSEALDALARRASESGITNVRCVRGRWEEVDVPAGDIVISSFVLPLIPNARPFLRKLTTHAQRDVLLYLSAFSGDAVLDPLWRHFHARPRRPAPTYLDAVAVLQELGVEPTVEVVEVPNRSAYATLEEAVDDHIDVLAVEDTDEVRERLRSLLGMWLVERGGRLRTPLPAMPAAIVRWGPGAP